MRFRNILIVGTPIAILLGLLLTDPDKGVSTAMWVLGTVSGLVAVALAHFSRKGLFDYIDLNKISNKAKEDPVGAGLVFLGVAMVLSSLLQLFGHMVK
jgi:hypothetical protein